MKDGGPAFPGQWIDRDSTGEQVVRESYPGMSLRDWFAGTDNLKIEFPDLETLCAFINEPVLDPKEQTWTNLFGLAMRGAARARYQYADAMLAEREK